MPPRSPQDRHGVAFCTDFGRFGINFGINFGIIVEPFDIIFLHLFSISIFTEFWMAGKKRGKVKLYSDHSKDGEVGCFVSCLVSCVVSWLVGLLVVWLVGW